MHPDKKSGSCIQHSQIQTRTPMRFRLRAPSPETASREVFLWASLPRLRRRAQSAVRPHKTYARRDPWMSKETHGWSCSVQSAIGLRNFGIRHWAPRRHPNIQIFCDPRRPSRRPSRRLSGRPTWTAVGTAVKTVNKKCWDPRVINN